MEVILHNNRILKRVDHDLFTGWAPAEEFKILTEKPKFRWKGAKIPFDLWCSVVSFLRWTQTAFKEEAHMTFFYNPTNREWKAWPFPQEPNGLNVSLLPDHPLYKTDREQFNGDWIQAGSIHHHCTMAAFQSSTDTEDESNKDGVHITIGKMEDSAIDIHIRQVFDGVMGDTTVLDWIGIPSYLDNVPPHLRYDFAIWAMKNAKNDEFPEIWKSRILPKRATGFTPGAQGTLLGLGSQQNQADTRTHGEHSTGRGKKNERSTGNAAPYSSKPFMNWELKNLEKVHEILLNLGLTLEEGIRFLKETPDAMWTTEDRLLSKAFKEDMRKTGIPLLYLEGLMERANEQLSTT